MNEVINTISLTFIQKPWFLIVTVYNAGVILHSQNCITTPKNTYNVCSCLPFVGWRE